VLDRLFDQPGTVALERRLELLDARRGAIAANLANAETPGYQPITARLADGFGAILAGRLGAPGARAESLGSLSSPVAIAYVPETAGTILPNGNGVDVDAEMARLAQTQLWYAAGARQLQLGFERLRTAIDIAGG
jgi:flagellar basal-body rod protein FlgB